MEKVFEDAFMDAQSELISLCLELPSIKVDCVYAHCMIRKEEIAFNAFFSCGNRLLPLQQVNSDRILVKRFLIIGIDDVENIAAICKKYGRKTPTEIKLIYDINSGKFDAKYDYDDAKINQLIDEGVDPFEVWMGERRFDIMKK